MGSGTSPLTKCNFHATWTERARVKNCYKVNKGNLNLTACIVLIYPFGVLALSCFLHVQAPTRK